MKSIYEPGRDVPVIAEPDVLVVGSGPAGFSAAVSAARNGATTMLVEQNGDVGGVSTVGLMSHWTGQTKGGIYEEILNRSVDAGEDLVKAQPFLRVAINPEKLKTVYIEMLSEANVQLRLYTLAVGVIVANGKIQNVITESKSGREAIAAKCVIDASGDGDIAAKSGVPFTIGREEDNLMQPMTLMFKVAGVDMSQAVLPGSFEEISRYLKAPSRIWPSRIFRHRQGTCCSTEHHFPALLRAI